MTTFFPSSTQAVAQSKKLEKHIQQEIAANQGKITFARFMELALYFPELGYYHADRQKLGPAGDFITAGEISPLFAKCFATQFQFIFNFLPTQNILEFGAGSGKFAHAILAELALLHALPQHYFIVEISPALQKQQLKYFQKACPQFLPMISWLNTLPTAFEGIIFANEVLDAMPFHCFEWSKQTVKERYVSWQEEQFVWQTDIPSNKVKNAVNNILKNYPFPNFYRSEVNLIHSSWIADVAKTLRCGVIFLVDYGYGQREYYHPQRTDGTFKCFYQHHSHSNPFINVGLQDITAHVDFTRIAESALEHGLDLLGFTSQAAFLLASGVLEHAEATKGITVTEQYTQAQQIKTLLLPSEMGEIIKVMGLTKEFDTSLPAFHMQDRRKDL